MVLNIAKTLAPLEKPQKRTITKDEIYLPSQSL